MSVHVLRLAAARIEGGILCRTGGVGHPGGVSSLHVYFRARRRSFVRIRFLVAEESRSW